MSEKIDNNALRASNVKFSNGALKSMEQDSYIENEAKGVGVRKPCYRACLNILGKPEAGKKIYCVTLYGKQPNGAKVDKNVENEFDFTNLSHADIQIGNDDYSKTKFLNLFGGRRVYIDAKNGKTDYISICNTKDSKSEDLHIEMDKGDVLCDYTQNVDYTANGLTRYYQFGDKGYYIDTELGVAGRIKSEHHDKNGKVTTKYYSKDYKTELKEDYALSKQRKTSDGYVINTWKNGKISIFDKDGKALPAGTKVKILKTKSGQETVQVMQK